MTNAFAAMVRKAPAKHVNHGAKVPRSFGLVNVS